MFYFHIWGQMYNFFPRNTGLITFFTQKRFRLAVFTHHSSFFTSKKQAKKMNNDTLLYL